MNTTENNKLIDDFVGSKGEWHSSKDSWGSEVWGEYKPNNYHSDWNLLMEVVHKITILEEFQEWEFNSLFWEVFCQIDITEIYNQVVLFIEYYNENSADKN